MNSLVVNACIAVAALLAGAVSALVLHVAGMPIPLIVVTAVAVAGFAVVVQWRRGTRGGRS